MLEVKNLTKKYFINTPREFFALKNLSFSIQQGELVAILGKSGSGKSTLLNAIGGLETPDDGEVMYDNQSIYTNKKRLANFRGAYIGFVFQSYNLIPNLTALENVQLALDILDTPKKISAKKSKDILEFLGLNQFINNKAIELSGGQQQRVAIARALVKEPYIILADEATGNLDTENAQAIINLFIKIHKEKKTTVLMVTHDLDVAAQAQRLIEIQDGKIIQDKKNEAE